MFDYRLITPAALFSCRGAGEFRQKPAGLMAIGPRGAGEDRLHQYFASLRLLQEACAERFGSEYFRELSMGMSNDFEAAILEGATMVRIGTAIFGPRKQTANQDVAKSGPGS